MNNITKLLAVTLTCLQLISCNVPNLDYGEPLTYPGAVDSLKYNPGNRRVELNWFTSSDPTITSYGIFWNNGSDSLMVESDEINPSEKAGVIVSGLMETLYGFSVYSYDSKGNRSIPKEINNVRIYGEKYIEGLINRKYNAAKPYVDNGDGSVTLQFIAPDTVNVNTEIVFTDISGEEQVLNLEAEENNLLLPNYKSGTSVKYRSSYLPRTGAIDTFKVQEYSTFPEIAVLQELDKELFKAVGLPNDIEAYDSQTTLDQLWDGDGIGADYPNIFHSNGDRPLPHHFTIDLGKNYSTLAEMEIIGRPCCHNPVKFEIWGIESLEDASTVLPGNDPEWQDEAISKGWKLLQDVDRADDGVAPFKVILKDNSNIRYIRLRVKSVASGETSYSNLSELTFWAK
ncbi:DUF4998 domain-containing protein [Echinicola sp. 20G]|uniref:DUF4998 domain-containing protein n=1 Tax=Echinicola sp. 20G TaxID=2781961 RepID=UPI001910879E|nr:DUF4998 domain-containing protein [Echinicola sp. 20G]